MELLICELNNLINLFKQHELWFLSPSYTAGAAAARFKFNPSAFFFVKKIPLVCATAASACLFPSTFLNSIYQVY